MTTDPTDPWRRRVQALLAKAESTEFPDEAEALLAKAQELMTRHAIDEATLDAGQTPDDIANEVVVVDPPYASARATLLSAVARANGCRCVYTGSRRGPVRCVLVGFRSDIDKATMLFGGLSQHAVRAMLAQPVPEFETARRFRHSFLLGFAARIGARLSTVAEATRREAERSTGPSSGASVVLADREVRVDEAFHAAFPFTRAATTSASSHAGSMSGHAAAERASLGHQSIAHRRELPR